MTLLYQDEYLIAINKPAGFHVHPHENPLHRVSRDKICLYQARRMMGGQHVFPVHRLDAATSGVLLFALSSEVARLICHQFAQRIPQKTYHAVVRGFTQPEGSIDLELELDSTGEKVPARTVYKTLAYLELPHPVGKKFATARYSLMEIYPETGRYHQIRRHFNRISHPLLGDAVHGDSHHNRFFREFLGISGLCLKATRLDLPHPVSGIKLSIKAPPCEKWNNIHDLFAQKAQPKN